MLFEKVFSVTVHPRLEVGIKVEYDLKFVFSEQTKDPI